jgi:hypothetical protein
MPFKKASPNKIYKNIVKPTIESKGLECLRADDYETNEAVMKDIWKAICQAQFVIAEMTGLNPNIMYELGDITHLRDTNHHDGATQQEGKISF